MPAIHVYVSAELERQMQAVATPFFPNKKGVVLAYVHVNWSAIAQRAFKREVERLSRKKRK